MPNDQLQQLLQMAANRVGKSPAELQQQLQNGQMDALLGTLSPQQQQQMRQVIQNPQALAQLLQNPQLRQMLQKFGGR